MSENNAMSAPLNPVDLHDAQQVKEYFARLERDYPQIIEAMNVMGVSYQQYLVAIRSLSPHFSFSSNHTEITL